MAKADSSKSLELPRFSSRVKNLAGQKLGRLTVLEFYGRNKSSLVLWLCSCECGNTGIVASTFALTSGTKRSCGCLGRDVTAARSVKHGMTASPEYRSWRGMKHRCCNKKATGYENYGGRGITVCERWLGSFENFFADMGRRPDPVENYELDRIDNEGNYEPSNCRWATIKQQANNRRKKSRLGVRSNSRFIEYNGETVILADLARRFDISYHRLHQRIASGWDVQRAISTPFS